MSNDTTSPIVVSDNAIAEVRKYIEEQGHPEGAALRIGVLPGGCSGFQYGMEVVEEPAEDDFSFDVKGLKLVVDPFSLQYLDGVRIDYVTTFQGSGFVFDNPNASGGCGCGSSFTV